MKLFVPVVISIAVSASAGVSPFAVAEVSPENKTSASAKTAPLKVSASKSFRDARRKFNKGDFAGAAISFTQTIAANPNNVDAYMYRGLSRYHLHDYRGAVSDYEKALDLAPGRSNDALLQLGKSHHFLTDYNQAVKMFSNLIGKDPKNAEAYACRASAYDALGDSHKVLGDLDEAIKLKPDDADLFIQRAIQYKHLRENVKALADFDRAVKLQPSLVHWRASFQNELGKHSEALDDYSMALRFLSGSRKAIQLVNRAVVYAEVGDYNSAIDDLDDAIERDPQLVEAYVKRGIVLLMRGDYKRAIADWTLALKDRPKDTDLRARMALAYHAQGDTPKAIESLTEALALKPHNPATLLSRRASYYCEIGKSQLAIADYTSAIEHDAKDAELYLDRGIEHIGMAQPAKAIDDFSQAIKLDPAHGVAYKYRGLAQLQLGKSEEALKDFHEAALLFTKNGDRFGEMQVSRLIAKMKATN